MERVIQAVRDRILDWALELERQGITGSGVSFSPAEANKAKTSPVIYNIRSIGNVGVWGDVSGESQVNVQSITQTGIDAKGLTDLLQAIRWASSGADSKSKQQVEAELAIVEEEISAIRILSLILH